MKNWWSMSDSETSDDWHLSSRIPSPFDHLALPSGLWILHSSHAKHFPGINWELFPRLVQTKETSDMTGDRLSQDKMMRLPKSVHRLVILWISPKVAHNSSTSAVLTKQLKPKNRVLPHHPLMRIRGGIEADAWVSCAIDLAYDCTYVPSSDWTLVSSYSIDKHYFAIFTIAWFS